MNWKAEATEKLCKLQAMRHAVQNLPEEIARLELAARSLRSVGMDMTPVKGGGDRREDALLSNLVHRQELQWSLEQAQSWLRIVEHGMQVLNPEEKQVLEQMYIDPQAGAVESLCMQLGMERSSVYRKRDKALHKFTLALYGAVES